MMNLSCFRANVLGLTHLSGTTLTALRVKAKVALTPKDVAKAERYRRFIFLGHRLIAKN